MTSEPEKQVSIHHGVDSFLRWGPGPGVNEKKQDSNANEQVGPTSSLGPINLADLLKLSALAGFVLYVAMFLGYYRYYQDLGLRPEDVGVSNAYILVRSTAFVTFIVILFGLLAFMYWQNSKIRYDQPFAPADWFRLAMVGLASLLLCSFEAFLTPYDWPSWVDPAVAVAGSLIIVVALYSAHKNQHEGWVVFAVPALLLTVLFPATSIAARANDLGQQVLAGRQVSPLQIFNVPILDISAKFADVTWIGPAGQRPAMFGKNSPESISSLLLGYGSGTVFILISDNHELRVVDLPSNLVMVESS
jgi:hypothetical protein